jgi:hypothetical protein
MIAASQTMQQQELDKDTTSNKDPARADIPATSVRQQKQEC